MPENPYLEDATKRQAQIGQLRDQPKASTMPVGGDARGDFMRITQRFSPNPSGLDSLFGDTEFRTRFPQARIHKNDWVDLGEGSGLIDTVRGFDRDSGAGEAWQWLPEAEAIAGKQMESRGRQMNPQALIANDNSALTRILAELSAASSGDMSPAEREAVLAMLQGG